MRGKRVWEADQERIPVEIRGLERGEEGSGREEKGLRQTNRWLLSVESAAFVVRSSLLPVLMTVNMVSGAVKGEKITSWKAIDWSPSFLRKAVTCEYFIMGESRAAHTDGGTGSFGVAQPEWERWAETLAFISLSSCTLSSAGEEVLCAKIHTSSYLQQYTHQAIKTSDNMDSRR